MKPIQKLRDASEMEELNQQINELLCSPYITATYVQLVCFSFLLYPNTLASLACSLATFYLPTAFRNYLVYERKSMEKISPVLPSDVVNQEIRKSALIFITILNLAISICYTTFLRHTGITYVIPCLLSLIITSCLYKAYKDIDDKLMLLEQV